MVTRDDIVAAARTWIGVRWQHQGRTRHGIDCIGLPAVVAFELGLIAALPAADYPRRPNGTFLTRFRASGLAEIRPAEAGAGDLVVFTAGTMACHCGIRAAMYGRPSIVHAHAAGRRVREELLAEIPATLGIVTHAFQFPNLTE